MPPARLQPGLGLAVVFFLGLAVLSLTVGGLAQLAGLGAGLIFTEIFVFAAPSVVLAHELGRSARQLLRTGPVSPRLVVVGALVGVVNYPTAMVLEGAMHRLLPHLAERFDIGAALAIPTGWSRVLLVVGVGVFAPFGEELAFRGAIQQLLRTALSDARAIAVTAVLFAAIHFDPIGALGRVELGVLFGAMAVWSGSVWVGMAAHAASNLSAMALFYAVGGRSDDALPSGLQMLGLLVAGVVLTAPLVALLHRWTRPLPRSLPPPESDDSPHSLPLRPDEARGGTEIILWLAAMLGAFGLLVAFDLRDWHLNVIDAKNPYHQGLAAGAPRATLDQRLHELRERAEKGSITVESYEAFRKHLFKMAQDHQADHGLEANDVEDAIARFEADGGV